MVGHAGFDAEDLADFVEFDFVGLVSRGVVGDEAEADEVVIFFDLLDAFGDDRVGNDDIDGVVFEGFAALDGFADDVIAVGDIGHHAIAANLESDEIAFHVGDGEAGKLGEVVVGAERHGIACHCFLGHEGYIIAAFDYFFGDAEGLVFDVVGIGAEHDVAAAEEIVDIDIEEFHEFVDLLDSQVALLLHDIVNHVIISAQFFSQAGFVFNHAHLAHLFVERAKALVDYGVANFFVFHIKKKIYNEFIVSYFTT